MIKPYEIVFIVMLVLTIVAAHSVPVIANEYVSENYKNYIPWPENKSLDNNISINLVKNGRKYKDIFDYSGLSLFVFDDSFKIKSEENNSKIRLGDNYVLLENNVLEDKLKFVLDKYIKNDYLIFFVKAKKGHKIDNGKLEMLHSFDGKLKEAKKIWYMFVNLNWKFKNNWVFNVGSDYFAPENNSIIEFTNTEEFGLSELKCDDSKYFMTIIIFE